ncbi:MAG TPA: aminoglycoside phosphotransferase family protein [Pirellulales bacterium]
MQPDWKKIESEVPRLSVSSAILLGEGWTARAYRVNDELVFKFPKRAADWDELNREIAFLAYARPLLPLPVAEHLFQIRNSKGAPHGYGVYRNIPGEAVSFSELSDAARADLATVLARFLRSLHDLRASPSLESVLRTGEDRTESEQRLSEAQEKVAQGLTVSERRCLSNALARHAEHPENCSVESRIIHADFSAQHILYADKGVTGILDWGEVSFGDPDYDFCYLYGEFGEAFVRDVASRYGHQDLERLVRKAHYFWLVDQIDAIAYGGGRAPAGDEEASWRQLKALLHQAEWLSNN